MAPRDDRKATVVFFGTLARGFEVYSRSTANRHSESDPRLRQRSLERFYKGGGSENEYWELHVLRSGASSFEIYYAVYGIKTASSEGRSGGVFGFGLVLNIGLPRQIEALAVDIFDAAVKSFSKQGRLFSRSPQGKLSFALNKFDDEAPYLDQALDVIEDRVFELIAREGLQEHIPVATGTKAPTLTLGATPEEIEANLVKFGSIVLVSSNHPHLARSMPMGGELGEPVRDAAGDANIVATTALSKIAARCRAQGLKVQKELSTLQDFIGELEEAAIARKPEAPAVFNQAVGTGLQLVPSRPETTITKTNVFNSNEREESWGKLLRWAMLGVAALIFLVVVVGVISNSSMPVISEVTVRSQSEAPITSSSEVPAVNPANSNVLSVEVGHGPGVPKVALDRRYLDLSIFLDEMVESRQIVGSANEFVDQVVDFLWRRYRMTDFFRDPIEHATFIKHANPNSYAAVNELIRAKGGTSGSRQGIGYDDHVAWRSEIGTLQIAPRR